MNMQSDRQVGRQVGQVDNTRRITTEILVFVVLAASGIGLRMVFRDLPNFAPVAAMALFAGYFFRSKLLAVCLPLVIMGVSDRWVGGYEVRMMVVVYAMLVFPVALRGPLRRWLPLQGRSKLATASSCGGLLLAGVSSSVLFFLVTNFACWLWIGMYELSLGGLLRCYVQAIPFFRYTLAGDLFFAATLFGGYALIARRATAPQSLPVPQA